MEKAIFYKSLFLIFFINFFPLVFFFVYKVYYSISNRTNSVKQKEKALTIKNRSIIPSTIALFLMFWQINIFYDNHLDIYTCTLLLISIIAMLLNIGWVYMTIRSRYQ